MSVAVCPSEPPRGTPGTNRAVAGVSIGVRRDGPITAVDSLHEFGGYRIKAPSPRADPLEAVVINTGGGVAGGDRVTLAASARSASRLAVTTATAERIYRSDGADTDVRVDLTVEAGATLAWLPQATILYSGARLRRRITASVHPQGRLLIAETTAYGRTASGEAMTHGSLSDQWRIERGGILVFADALRLDGHISSALDRPAVAGGARLTSLMLFVAPEAEQRRDAVREAMTGSRCLVGISAWNGLLVMRLTGERLDVVANGLRAAVAALDIIPLPLAWTH